MHSHAFSRAYVGGVKPGSVASHRGASPQFPMPKTPAAAAAASPSFVDARPRTRRGMAHAGLRAAHRSFPRRARPLVPSSSLVGDAGALADSGGGNSGGGGGGGKGLGGDGKGGDSGSGENSGGGKDENAPISAAAIAATVCFFLFFFFSKEEQLTPFESPFDLFLWFRRADSVSTRRNLSTGAKERAK